MTEQNNEMSDEEALMKLAQAMKDNAPTQDDKHSVHTFLFNVVTAGDSKKIGNLRDDKELSELGLPAHTVRGSLELARIADKIMENEEFKGFFIAEAEESLATSLSRSGFLVRQATTQTRQVADVTKRIKKNKGWFGNKEEVQGGDTTGSANS